MTTLGERVAALPAGPELVAPVALESGAVVALDREARWVHTSAEGARTVFAPAVALAFAEVVEGPRDAFEEALAKSARDAGLPDDLAIAAFPAVELVRAVLAKQFAYMTRLALLWIRPSELRELRAEIRVVADAPQMPGPIKDLARRLTVPEGFG